MRSSAAIRSSRSFEAGMCGGGGGEDAEADQMCISELQGSSDVDRYSRGQGTLPKLELKRTLDQWWIRGQSGTCTRYQKGLHSTHAAVMIWDCFCSRFSPNVNYEGVWFQQRN